MTTKNTPHFRAAELAATVAVDMSKLVTGKDSDHPGQVSSWYERDAGCIGAKTQIIDVMWSTTTTGGPTIIFVLANGQEFEAEVRPSTKALRDARLAVESATLRAQRAQDEAREG